MICFYHRVDFDGICSAAIVRHFKSDNCELYGINYDDEFPWDKISPNEKVYMCDFSIQPYSKMTKLNDLCDLTWIDHHKSALNAVDNTIEGLRDEKYSGCELTWMYFNGFHPDDIPLSVRLLGRWDVWDHSWHNDVELFQIGINMTDDAIPENQDFWKELFFSDTTHNQTIESIVNMGYHGKKWRDNFYKDIVKNHSFEWEYNGYNLICCNQGLTGSKLFDSVYDANKHDILLVFYYKGGKWNFSLYTTKDNIDCSKIALSFGGGGHTNAAGFTIDYLPWEK